MPTHEPGTRLQAKIVRAAPREIGTKDAIEVKAELASGELVSALIFLTQAAANMARAQLKACGFDADTQSLAALLNNDQLLAGNFVEIEADEYNGKPQWKIVTGKPVPKSRLAGHDSMLRAAKERDATEPVAAAINEPPPFTDDDIPF